MTTVAYRNGIMAADTMALRGSIPRICKKLYRLGDTIIGLAGNLSDGLVFIDWWERGHDIADWPIFHMYRGNEDAPDISALVLTADGLDLWTEHAQPIPILDDFFAIGSGTAAAMAAMHMGADPIRAVEIAMLVDYSTGGDIMSETINA
jgi:ATP-dependent protease HslVU (ClpYQ) peptidase subunit